MDESEEVGKDEGECWMKVRRWVRMRVRVR